MQKPIHNWIVMINVAGFFGFLYFEPLKNKRITAFESLNREALGASGFLTTMIFRPCSAKSLF